MTVQRIQDLRRHVTQVTHGMTILMYHVQGIFDDIKGGIPAGQWGLVAAQTRYLVFHCLHVRGLADGADPSGFTESVAFDPYRNVSEVDRVAGLRFIHGARDLAAHPEQAGEWLAALTDWIDETERSLGLDEQLPILRSPDGMFGALRLARERIDVATELGLPPMFPKAWNTPV